MSRDNCAISDITYSVRATLLHGQKYCDGCCFKYQTLPGGEAMASCRQPRRLRTHKSYEPWHGNPTPALSCSIPLVPCPTTSSDKGSGRHSSYHTKRNQRILDLEHLESFGPKQTILISIKRRICSVLATSLNMGRATTHSILAYSVADAMGPLRYLPALILEWISSLVAAAWSTTKQT